VPEELIHLPPDAEVKPAQIELERRIHRAVQLPGVAYVQLQGGV
jgi:hypothetical protein